MGIGGNLQFDLTGPNGFSGFSALTSDSNLVTLPTSGNYQVIATGITGDTGQYSFRLIETAVTDITLGQASQQTHSGSNSARLFRISTTEAAPMIVRLNDASDTNRNELYLRRGQADCAILGNLQ